MEIAVIGSEDFVLGFRLAGLRRVCFEKVLLNILKLEFYL